MIKLGVNIDHVATVRNARGKYYPDPYLAAKTSIKAGADSVTVHLREDRRHIIDKDVIKIAKDKNIPLNLEIAATNEMIKIALKIKPNYVCIVPEKRKEITTEGGLNLKKKTYYLKKIIGKFNSKNIRTSLFINPSIKDVLIANQIGTKCIELHTGKFCNFINNKKKYLIELNKIKKCMILGKNLGLEVHAGHGLTYKTTKIITKLNGLKELNIGHFIIGESIFNGLKKTISNFKNIIKK